MAPALLLKAIRSSRTLHSRLSSTATSSSPPPPLPHSIPTLLFFGFPVALTFSLGTWQMYRLDRKLRLLEQREESLSSPPLDSHTLLSSPLSSTDHRTTTLTGRLLHSKEMLVGPRSAPKSLPPAVVQWGGSSGLQVITPMVLENDGGTVLVNRGWIPQRLAKREKRDKASVNAQTFEEKPAESIDFSDKENRSQVVSVMGVVRGSDERNRFTPANFPEKNEWYFVDVKDMCAKAGIDDSQIVVELVEPNAECGWPVMRKKAEFLGFATMPDTHRVYAATWFMLSAALAVLVRKRLRTPTRRGA